MKGLWTNEQGFTLMEILVAVTIVGISFAIIIEGYISLSGLTQQIREYQQVNFFASNKLNQVIHQTELGLAGQEELESITIDWQVNSQDMGDGVKIMEIIVKWQGRRGEREHSLVTLIEGGSYD